MLLRKSQYSGNWNYDTVNEVVASAKGKDLRGLRNEFLELIRSAQAVDDRDR